MKTQWLKICEDLQNRLNPGTYKVWVAPLTADLEGEGKIRLSAPNGFVATWVRDRLLNDISDAASAIFGRTMEISPPSRAVPFRGVLPSPLRVSPLRPVVPVRLPRPVRWPLRLCFLPLPSSFPCLSPCP